MMATRRTWRSLDGRVIETTNAITSGSGIHGHGVVVRERPSVQPERAMCSGCRDDYYNTANAPEGCWMFKSAKVVDKVGHATLNVCGGPDTVMRGTLSCWHGVRH